MPMSKSGKYFANPQQARAHDNAPAPPPIGGADGGEQEPAEQSITITKTPEGFHYTEPSGEEGDLASFDEVMQKAQECLGEAAPAEDEGAEAMPGAGEESEGGQY